MNLNFHQTFKPESKYLTELLMIADNCVKQTKEEISLATGIPQGASSGKLIPHIEYAKLMGLINVNVSKGEYTIELTSLGRLIKEEDVCLSEDITIMLLHGMLVREEKGADLWNFFFHKFQSKYGTESNMKVLQAEADDYFLSSVALSPFKVSYEDLFGCLDLVAIDKNGELNINKHKYNNQFDYLYAYLLFEYWDNKYENQDEISINELSNLNFRYTFGWDLNDESFVLEQLAKRGIVRLNKQLMPYTILKLNDKGALLEDIYSELF